MISGMFYTTGANYKYERIVYLIKIIGILVAIHFNRWRRLVRYVGRLEVIKVTAGEICLH